MGAKVSAVYRYDGGSDHRGLVGQLVMEELRVRIDGREVS